MLFHTLNLLLKDSLRLGSDFTKQGFTAMSHPAPTEIGLTHGVFLLEKDMLAEHNQGFL